jgi:formylglycine-generating enzyme required for sulfatase activity
MVFVKGSTFQMGSPAHETDRYDDEVQHAVTLSDFEIGKYPVTQKLWTDIMGSNPSHFKGDALPVEQVSWEDCQEFLKKLNQKTGKKYRLPTEAEWEFAVCGGTFSTSFQYAGSNDLNEVSWYSGNSGAKTHPVGQKKANKLGLYDISGNVWEWCADWYGKYPANAQTNPAGPASGPRRVLRGGSWHLNARYCRVAYRDYSTPEYRY